MSHGLIKKSNAFHQWWLTGLLLFSVSATAALPAGLKYTINRAESPIHESNTVLIPYFFSSETMGFNVGLGGAVQGVGQEQLVMGATAWAGLDSYGLFGGFWNYNPWFSKRTYISLAGMYAYFPDHRAYTGGKLTPSPINQPLPGSSDSTIDQYIEGEGFANWLDFKIEYVLPIGSSKNSSIINYNLRNGLLIDGPSQSHWNPLKNGSTVVMFRQFNRYQSYQVEGARLSGDIVAMEIGLLHDNTDFVPNPTMGSRQYIGYGFEPSRDYWDFVQLDLSKFMSIGESEWASQRILAFNFWTAYSPSWQVKKLDNDMRIIENSPPYNEGATLGGYKRLRGYDSSRFHDKASIYATAEYRYTFRYNPIKEVSWLRFLKLDWFQLVGFAEVGQVAEHYNLSDLTSDMKIDAGVSLRALTGGLVVRADYALSEEGSYMWFMLNHPF